MKLPTNYVCKQMTDVKLWLLYLKPINCGPSQLGLSCPGYGIKQSDGEIPVMLELLGIWNTPSLPFLQDPLWPGVVAPDRVLSMGQIELNSVLMLN